MLLGIDYSFKIEFWIIVDCGFSKGYIGITTLKIYQYRIFDKAVIETCFEMLKSLEHQKLGCISNHKSQKL